MHGLLVDCNGIPSQLGPRYLAVIDRQGLEAMDSLRQQVDPLDAVVIHYQSIKSCWRASFGACYASATWTLIGRCGT